MNVDKRIMNALSALAPIDHDELSDWRSPGYTFNYNTLPITFRNNRPSHERYLIQVHLFCPIDFNNLSLRKETKESLYRAGFGWPDEIDVGLEKEKPGDVTLKHFVYECECTKRVVLDG